MDEPAADGGRGTVRFGPLAQVSLFVREIAAGVAFYSETLGLTHLFTVGAMAFLDIDGVRLYLHQAEEGQWRASSFLYFLVPDIDAAYGHLQSAGVTTLGAPHLVHTDAAGVQEWMAFFDDPDGNTLGLIARMPSPPSPAPP